MSVVLAKSAGFCYGVRRAVELAERTAEEGRPCVMLGSIIHNKDVIARLAEKGLTAVERPRPAICISVGRGLALQAAALLLLAAVWGGSVIWFAPVISEALCLVMALVFMTRFWRKTPDPAQIS